MAKVLCTLLTKRQKLIYPNVLIAKLDSIRIDTLSLAWFTSQTYILEYKLSLSMFILSHMRLLTYKYVGQFVLLATGLAGAQPGQALTALQ